MKFLRLSLALLTLSFPAVPALAGGFSGHLPAGLTPLGGPLIPPTFQGIWNYTEVYKDCTTLQILATESGTDTVCAEDNVAPPDTLIGGGIACDYTSSDTEYTVTCIGSQEITPGCTQSYNISVIATLNGNMVTSVTTITVSYTGCGPIPASCTRYEYTGTRVGSAMVECATPVLPTTWSGIKTRNRF